MQTAGNLVGIVVEFPAGMQNGHDDFGCGAAFFRVNVHGYSTAVVRNRDGFVRVNGYRDSIAKTRQSLVDGVVNHLKDHVVQSRAVIGVADVHSGALADRFESA